MNKALGHRLIGPGDLVALSFVGHSLRHAIRCSKATFWLCTCTLLAACNQEGILGLDLLPENNRFPTVTDSVELVGSTVLEDSLQSQLPSSLLMGELIDPHFGKSSASFAFQILPTSENIRLADPDSSLTLDSLILSISLAGYQGDTNTTLLVRAHEINPTVSSSKVYFSRDAVRTTGPILATRNYRYRSGLIQPINEPADTSIGTIVNVSGVFRMRLDDQNGFPEGTALANKLLNGRESIEYKNADAFVQFFKGLWIEAVIHPDAVHNGTGLLLQSNPIATKTGLYLYYRSGNKRRRLDLMLQPMSGSRNIFQFDYAGSNLQEHLFQNSGTDTNLKVSYVQAGSGAKTRLSSDSLYRILKNRAGLDSLNLPSGNRWIIHQAALEFENADSSALGKIAPPAQLFLVPLDSQGLNMASLMPDLFESYYDGYLRNGKYKFGITRYIQKLMTEGPKGYDLAVIPGNPMGSLARVRLKTKPRLRITYTRIP